MNNGLPESYSVKGCMNYIANSIKEKAITTNYEGDISDLGNEIGYCLGICIADMTEEQTSDFISGLRHGVSLTNGTH